MELWILFGVFSVLLLIGVPVAFCLGIASVTTVAYMGLPPVVVFQQMNSGMNAFAMMAIPFFIYAGDLMIRGGIAERLIQMAASLVGHLRGGLGQVNVVTCTLFGGISGSAVADASAVGGLMIPQMKKRGYDADYAVNVTANAAIIALLIPPSHNMIIYSLAAGGHVSIGALILAGVVPTIVLALCMLAAAYWVAVKRGYPHGSWLGWGAVARSGLRALPGLFVAVIIIVGILSGVFTATESAAIAVVYAILITTIGYRSMTWDNFLRASAKAVKTTGVVLLLIGVSATFQYLIGLYQVAPMTGAWMAGISDTPWVVFMMINLILFVLGTFMDMASTILICTPIFLPIAMSYGMDPVQFGMVMLVNCALGLNTPPVGTTQFIGCAIGGISVGAVMRTILPFYAALLAALFAVTYVPAFSLWLPRLLLG